MRIIALALVVAVSTSCAGAYRTSQVAFVASQALDLHSTHVALSQGNVEANALMRGSDAKRIVIKSAAVVAILAAAQHIRRQEHKTLATAILTAFSVAYGVIASRNYRLGQ